jgi:hypothetical protein
MANRNHRHLPHIPAGMDSPIAASRDRAIYAEASDAALLARRDATPILAPKSAPQSAPKPRPEPAARAIQGIRLRIGGLAKASREAGLLELASALEALLPMVSEAARESH